MWQVREHGRNNVAFCFITLASFIPRKNNFLSFAFSIFLSGHYFVQIKKRKKAAELLLDSDTCENTINDWENYNYIKQWLIKKFSFPRNIY